MEVKIYTDGAARGNPDGPGGYGTILEYVDRTGTLHTKELSQGYVKTTNNRMELMAVIAGLEALVRPCRVKLYSDSKYVVDAFTDTVIGGNPAAVCLLDAFPEDKWMQKIAQENHLSETAFLVKKEGDYDLRWFTPGGEIDLCGHATLAAAYVIME